MLKNKVKNNNGITLIALVITIIILLILATISIQSLTNTGIFKRAQEARNAMENAEAEQQLMLNEYENELNKYYTPESKPKSNLVADNTNTLLSKTENTELEDAYGNKIVVPAGFKIVSDSTTGNAETVDQGIVIEDITETSTKGSQFVWIPVGTIYTDVERTDANKRVITLGRYDFDPSTGVESECSRTYVEEDSNDTSTIKNKGNTIAKNITNFKNSVTSNEGYYIGRYETRKNSSGTVTEVGTDTVWNLITQPEAADKAQKMYNSSNFISDLINSYAWDTTITFIQKCTDQTKYSRQKSLNTSLSQTGTTDDKQCNIFDMASNIVEWTTETSDISEAPCVFRGGIFDNPDVYTSFYNNNFTDNIAIGIGFRPILYINV